jgi:hypothetical protein
MSTRENTASDRLDPWEEKAHRLVAAECLAAWRHANLLPSGKRRARHVPYSVPTSAARLVELLGRKDRRAAELDAKSTFLAHAAAGGRFDP